MILRSLAAGVLAVSLAGGYSDATALARPDAHASPAAGALAVNFLRAPGDIGVNQTCTWEALAGGGMGPYTYTWTVEGSWSQSTGEFVEDYSFDTFFGGHATSTGWYWLTVTATDALGRTASRTTSGAVDLYYNFQCDW